MPPIPTKAQLAAAKAKEQAFIKTPPQGKATAAKAPTLASKPAAPALSEAQSLAGVSSSSAKQEPSSAPQMSFLSAGFGALSAPSTTAAPGSTAPSTLFGAAPALSSGASAAFGAAASGAPASFKLASSIAAPQSGALPSSVPVHMYRRFLCLMCLNVLDM